MLAEFKLGPQDWVHVIPLIATALNEASLTRLGRRPDGVPRSPLEVMTGISPKSQLLHVFPPTADFKNYPTIDSARAQQLISIDKLQHDLDVMHKDVELHVSDTRKTAIDAHNRATNIVPPSFSVGDFVLVRRATDRGHKL